MIDREEQFNIPETPANRKKISVKPDMKVQETPQGANVPESPANTQKAQTSEQTVKDTPTHDNPAKGKDQTVSTKTQKLNARMAIDTDD